MLDEDLPSIGNKHISRVIPPDNGKNTYQDIAENFWKRDL
jgi:hypothetical protein